jgi:hypothetical protein
MRTELLDRFAAVRRFGYQSQLRFRADEYSYALPNKSMIVNGKNPELS